MRRICAGVSGLRGLRGRTRCGIFVRRCTGSCLMLLLAVGLRLRLMLGLILELELGLILALVPRRFPRHPLGRTPILTSTPPRTRIPKCLVSSRCRQQLRRRIPQPNKRCTTHWQNSSGARSLLFGLGLRALRCCQRQWVRCRHRLSSRALRLRLRLRPLRLRLRSRLRSRSRIRWLLLRVRPGRIQITITRIHARRA